MLHCNLKRELDVLVLLTQNCAYSVDEICQKTGISHRSLYYYLDFFRSIGFEVEKYGAKYSITRNSEFFNQIFDKIEFTNEEALLLRKLISSQEVKNDRMKSILAKLESFYDFSQYDKEHGVQRLTRTMQRVREGMMKRRQIKIIGYSSPNSHSVTDRIVEPFIFMNNNKDVRCYEPASGKNKTFRISRMQGVEVLEEKWAHVDEHRQVYTDLFSFSGEQHYVITLHMGQLSHNLMLEEYPKSAPCFADMGNGKWLFRTEVCSYLGIGRFVLGLYDDIDVIGDDGFKDYLKEKIKGWASAQED